MQVKISKLNGKDLIKALELKYIFPEEECYVSNVINTYEEYKDKDYIHWIQCKKNTSVYWYTCGMITYGLDIDENKNNCWWIQRLMIIPEYRRKGIACQAIKIVLNNIPDNLNIYTSITENNIKSQKLFSKMGFIKTNRKWENEIIWQYKN